MNKQMIKKIFEKMGINPQTVREWISTVSIKAALNKKDITIIDELRKIEPDLSEQYSRPFDNYNEFIELKMRAQHAFQCKLMLRAIEPDLERYCNTKMAVVDIGDSAGTHMHYLEKLSRQKYNMEIDTLSVNLDSRAVDKIKSKGRKALLCRAEELDLVKDIALYTTFEMVEHLHNPAIFFYRLAKNGPSNKMVVTVPFIRNSRVGMHHLRNHNQQINFAENEHIFELNPEDWSLLMLHSGWRVIEGHTYYQYPRRIPIISQLLAYYWRTTDFEGFWGAILEKDMTYANLYQDWED
ncbi:MAG: class I SAM-dependent methyltransferase [Clostridiaceae bacterium]|nr:class I SAM-dependent methyltransferase [Clostridiaceae bacterium]